MGPSDDGVCMRINYIFNPPPPQSLQMAPAGPGTLMRMNDVVFAFLFGIFVLHEYPDAYSISGASIIVLMTSAMGIHKIYSHTKK